MKTLHQLLYNIIHCNTTILYIHDFYSKYHKDCFVLSKCPCIAISCNKYKCKNVASVNVNRVNVRIARRRWYKFNQVPTFSQVEINCFFNNISIITIAIDPSYMPIVAQNVIQIFNRIILYASILVGWCSE